MDTPEGAASEEAERASPNKCTITGPECQARRTQKARRGSRPRKARQREALTPSGQWKSGGKGSGSTPRLQGGARRAGAGAPKAGGLALPASPQRGRQGRGGGRGEPTATEAAAASDKQHRQATARAARGPRSESPGGQGRNTGARQGPAAPGAGARRRGGHKADEGTPQPGGDPAEEPAKRQSEHGAEQGRPNREPAAGGGRAKRSGASESPRRRAAPHKRPSGQAGGEAEGRHQARAARAAADPRRGRGPGATGDAECAKRAEGAPKGQRGDERPGAKGRTPQRVRGGQRPERAGWAPGVGPGTRPAAPRPQAVLAAHVAQPKEGRRRLGVRPDLFRLPIAMTGAS